MWNFKGTLWNSTQNILPIHWKIELLYNIEILRALRFKSSYVFLKRPPGYGLVLNRSQAIIWSDVDLIQCRAYASLGLNELTTIWHHGTSSALVWTMIHWSLCWCHMASLSWSTLVKVMAKPSPDSLLSIHYKRSVAFTQWQQFLRKYSWYQSLKCVEDHTFHRGHYINGLVQDCSISKALAMEILQFCTKPLLSY